MARTITSNRAHSEDLEPTIQLQILVGELPVHVDFHFILVLRASSGRVDLEIVERITYSNSFFPGTGFGSTGTSGFGGTTTNSTGSIFGGGTTTGFGGGTLLMFTLAWIVLRLDTHGVDLSSCFPYSICPIFSFIQTFNMLHIIPCKLRWKSSSSSVFQKSLETMLIK